MCTVDVSEQVYSSSYVEATACMWTVIVVTVQYLIVQTAASFAFVSLIDWANGIFVEGWLLQSAYKWEFKANAAWALSLQSSGSLD